MTNSQKWRHIETVFADSIILLITIHFMCSFFIIMAGDTLAHRVSSWDLDVPLLVKVLLKELCISGCTKYQRCTMWSDVRSTQ